MLLSNVTPIHFKKEKQQRRRLRVCFSRKIIYIGKILDNNRVDRHQAAEWKPSSAGRMFVQWLPLPDLLLFGGWTSRTGPLILLYFLS